MPNTEQAISSLDKLKDTRLGHEAGNSEGTRQPSFELELYTDNIFPAIVKCGNISLP